MSRFRFISEHRAVYGVKRLCRVLQAARSGYYAWLAGAAGRAARDARLVEQIRQVHTDTHGTYGSPRVTVELRAMGIVVNHKRVERLMREHQLVGRHLRRHHHTTRRDPAAPAAPDLLGRDFTANQPDTRWVGDITYLRVADRFLYLATVLDLHSRRLVGWSLASHARAELACDALQAAVATRGGNVDGVLFHTDHGAQAVHLGSVRRHLPGPWCGPVDGPHRRLARQRRGRELLRHAQARAGRSLGHRRAGPAGGVLLDRLLQPPPPALRPWLPQSHRVREDHRTPAACCMKSGVRSSGGTPEAPAFAATTRTRFISSVPGSGARC